MSKIFSAWIIFTICWLCFGCKEIVIGEDTSPPYAPADFQGQSGDQQVVLSWSANEEGDLGGYNLYRALESFNDILSMQPVNGDELLKDVQFTDQDLENGTVYYYRLTAVDIYGNESEVSNIVEVTPFSDPPSHP